MFGIFSKELKVDSMCWALFSGDLGQTYDSNMTLTHYELNPAKGKTVLYVGDLSYADNYPNHDNVRWDTWGRFVERSAAYQPWIWTTGNHEIDFAPEIVSILNIFHFFFFYAKLSFDRQLNSDVCVLDIKTLPLSEIIMKEGFFFAG